MQSVGTAERIGASFGKARRFRQLLMNSKAVIATMISAAVRLGEKL
jgi:hypothetical protein